MTLVTISECHTVGRTHTEIGESESNSGIPHVCHWLLLELEQSGAGACLQLIIHSFRFWWVWWDLPTVTTPQEAKVQICACDSRPVIEFVKKKKKKLKFGSR